MKQKTAHKITKSYRILLSISCVVLLCSLLSGCAFKFPDFKSGLFAFNADENNEYDELDGYENEDSTLVNDNDPVYGELSINPNTNVITLTNMVNEQYGYKISLDKIDIDDNGIGFGYTYVYITITNNGSGNLNIDQYNCAIIQDKTQYDPEYELGDTLIQSNIRPGVESKGFIKFPLINLSDMQVIIMAYNDNSDYMEFKFDLYIDPTDPNIFDDQRREQTFTEAILDYNEGTFVIDKVRYWPDSFWEGRFNLSVDITVINKGPYKISINYNDAILIQKNETFESVSVIETIPLDVIEPYTTVSGVLVFENVEFNDVSLEIPTNLIYENYDRSDTFYLNYELYIG